MFLIAGLGNPGPEYRSTRHNVGFRTVELLATRSGARWYDADRARIARARLMNREALLVQPLSYMNRSGEVLVDLSAEQPAEAMVVVYDDLDLPVGRLRVRQGGGSGGHRGVDSVIAHCGSDFTRVRIGIGRTPTGASAVDFVLGEFAPAESETIEAVLEGAASAVECVLARGVDAAMSCFNGKLYACGESVESAGGERDAKV